MTSSPPPPPPKTLLLDMDGVLAEVSRSYRASIVATCHKYGAKSVTFDTVAQWKARGGCNNDWILSRDLILDDPDGRKDVSLEEVTETFEKLYQGDVDAGVKGLCESESLIPKKETLVELRRRCEGRMAVVTGRPKKDCSKFLVQHKIDDLFDVCVCMEDGPAKPDPFPVRRACEMVGVEPGKDVVMVGDTPDDIRSALGCGCRGVGVATPENVAKGAKIGRSYDADDLCLAMKECGADLIVEPGLEGLLDIFPEN